ncbi:MAG: hypothetical protein HC892_20310 [Saprospiraceae bacterium]|nr:hypothetical protein [Saprospiraceae bacterium]
MMFTPALTRINATASLENALTPNEVKSSENKFLLSNLGGVFVGNPYASKWKTFNFALGYNQLASFEQDFEYEGISTGSIVDRFLEQVDGDDISDFESGLALDAIAVYDIDGDGIYETDFLTNPEAQLTRSQVVTRSGSIGELVLGLGGNYDDKLMVGFTLGIPFLSFTENKEYEETDPNDEVGFFTNLSYNENLTTTGVGINAKFGVMALVTKQIRLGLAIHTPSMYALEDSFSTAFVYTYDDQGIISNQAVSPSGLFDYRLRTPWRLIGGGSLVIKKAGFITTELEWVKYNTAQFNLTANSTNPDDEEYEKELNAQINSRFRSTLNFKVGGELVLLQVLKVRAGLGLGFSPYQDEDEINRLISIGVGYRKGRFLQTLLLEYHLSMKIIRLI